MPDPQQYRKKPVVITAMEWDGTAESATPIIDWVLANGGTARFSCSQPDSGPCRPGKPHSVAIDTLEGSMHASPGDYVIRGVQGEFYPCKPDIFAATYTLVQDLPGEYSQRGFYHWDFTETSYGHKVFVYESSAASAPHMWLRIVQDSGDIAAHLDVDQARTVRDQIDAWLTKQAA